MTLRYTLLPMVRPTGLPAANNYPAVLRKYRLLMVVPGPLEHALTPAREPPALPQLIPATVWLLLTWARHTSSLRRIVIANIHFPIRKAARTSEFRRNSSQPIHHNTSVANRQTIRVFSRMANMPWDLTPATGILSNARRCGLVTTSPVRRRRGNISTSETV